MAAQYDGTILINTAIDTDGFVAGGKEIEAHMRKVAESVKGIGNSAKISLKKTVESFVSQNQQFAAQKKKVEELKTELDQLSGKKVMTDDYSSALKAIADLQLKLEKVNKAQEDFMNAGGKESSSAYKRRANQIMELTQELKKAKDMEAAMRKEGTAYQSADTSALQQKYEAESAKLQQMNTKLGLSYEALTAKIEAYNAKAGKSAGIKGKLAAAAGLLLAKIKGLIPGMNKMNSATNKSGLSLKKLLMYGLGFRSLFALVNRLRSSVVAGFQNLSQYSGQTNADISMLMSALTRLKNSLATAFAPILSVVAPILTKFINLLSTAATYVSQFMSALTGKSSYVKAVKVQQDYAAGLKQTGNNAKDAKKELEGYLSPIDEINKMEKKDTDTSTGSGAGSGGVSPGQMFREEAIANPIKGVADRLRALFAAEDWQGLGAFMAQCVNEAFRWLYQALSWSNVGPEIVHYLTAFIVTFNSLIQNLDWDLIGRTLGTGINTVVNTLSRLISGIDWGAIGAALSMGLMGLVNEIDWNAFGLLIGSYFMIKWELLAEFVKGIDWGKIGQALGEALNGVVKAIDLATIGMTLGLAITGLCQAAIDFSATFDWTGLGENIANGINALLQNFDASAFGKGLSDFTNGFMDMLIVALSQTDWQGLGAKIGDFIVSVDWLGVAARLLIIGVFLIEGLLDGIVGALASIGTWMKTNVFDPIVNCFKNLFGIHSPSTVFAEFGRFLIEGLTNGIREKINTVLAIFEKLKSDLAVKWNDIKAGAEKTWNAIGDAAKNIWNIGIVGTIKQAVNSIIGLLNRMIAAVTDGVNSIFDKLNGLSIDIPDWVPELGGKHFGFDFSKFKAPKIPYLATGAVIPANSPFVAMLGDQKHGNNIEAPESLIRRIVREESGAKGGSYRFTGMINRRVLFDEFISEAKLRQDKTGMNPLTSF